MLRAAWLIQTALILGATTATFTNELRRKLRISLTKHLYLFSSSFYHCLFSCISKMLNANILANELLFSNSKLLFFGFGHILFLYLSLTVFIMFSQFIFPFEQRRNKLTLEQMVNYLNLYVCVCACV